MAGRPRKVTATIDGDEIEEGNGNDGDELDAGFTNGNGANQTQRFAIQEEALSASTTTRRSDQPYRMMIHLIGTSSLLFHAWKNVLPDDPDNAGKGDKKRDHLEDYVYRTAEDYLGIPGVCFTAAMREAGRSLKDPRSPRASMKELIKASILPLTEVAELEPRTKNWDFEHACRAVVQRNAITRVRPGMREGWMASFEVLIASPQYFPPHLVLKLAGDAGRLNGLCDFRPLYGRFTIRGSEILED